MKIVNLVRSALVARVLGPLLSQSLVRMPCAGFLVLIFVGLFLLRAPVSARSACLPRSCDLIAYWPADGSAVDVIGGHNGVLVGGARYASGFRGQAFEFDGRTAYVRVPHHRALSFAPGAQLTIEFWAYRTSEADPQHFIGKRD
ncbi:MAG TPA: hypothetical protein PKD27_08845, partial [Tepidiformaceae bacterium]|nr:hypothetical protein [Tepidiformaceae bacterium]